MAGLKAGYPLAGAKTPGLQVYCGNFITAGSSDPATATVYGAGYTVARTAAGTLTITIADAPFRRVVYADAQLEDATANANDTVRIGDVSTLTSSNTLTIITASSAGTDADLTGPVVHWVLFVSNTTVDR